MTIYEKIQDLCIKNNMSIRKLERDLDLGNNSIGKWRKSAPKYATLKKVADYFDVSVDYLTREDKEVCPECGMQYNLSIPDDVNKHIEFHRRFLRAKEYFPFLYNSLEASKIQKKYIYTFGYEKNSLEKHIKSVQELAESELSLDLWRRDYIFDESFSLKPYIESKVKYLLTNSWISYEHKTAIANTYNVDIDSIDVDINIMNEIKYNPRIMDIVRKLVQLDNTALEILAVQVEALASAPYLSSYDNHVPFKEYPGITNATIDLHETPKLSRKDTAKMLYESQTNNVTDNKVPTIKQMDNIVPFPQYPTVTNKDIDEFAARNAKKKFTREEIAGMLHEMKQEDE